MSLRYVVPHTHQFHTCTRSIVVPVDSSEEKTVLLVEAMEMRLEARLRCDTWLLERPTAEGTGIAATIQFALSRRACGWHWTTGATFGWHCTIGAF